MGQGCAVAEIFSDPFFRFFFFLGGGGGGGGRGDPPL